MLGHRGIANAQEFSEVADRALAVDQLANDEQPMAVGERLQQVARLIGSRFHHCDIYFHTCVYTIIRIYSQARQGDALALAPPIAGIKEVKTGT